MIYERSFPNRFRVLVLENQEEDFELMRLQLSMLGVQDVEWAKSVGEAAEIIGDDTPDLVVSDIMLDDPEASGFDLANSLIKWGSVLEENDVIAMLPYVFYTAAYPLDELQRRVDELSQQRPKEPFVLRSKTEGIGLDMLDRFCEENFRPARVWVVEDELWMRDLLVAAVGKPRGVQVSSFLSAEDAVEAMSTHSMPDLLITDLMLGGKMGGWDLSREFRARFSTGKEAFPVVYVSAATPALRKLENAAEPNSLVLDKVNGMFLQLEKGVFELLSKVYDYRV